MENALARQLPSLRCSGFQQVMFQQVMSIGLESGTGERASTA
jgi:hypothetical protein